MDDVFAGVEDLFSEEGVDPQVREQFKQIWLDELKASTIQIIGYSFSNN